MNQSIVPVCVTFCYILRFLQRQIHTDIRMLRIIKVTSLGVVSRFKNLIFMYL